MLLYGPMLASSGPIEGASNVPDRTFRLIDVPKKSSLLRVPRNLHNDRGRNAAFEHPRDRGVSKIVKVEVL